MPESIMNGEKTTNGNHNGHKSLYQPIMPKDPHRKPSGIDPVSPMNILAGGKLKNKNPIQAVIIIILNIAKSRSPIIIDKIA